MYRAPLYAREGEEKTTAIQHSQNPEYCETAAAAATPDDNAAVTGRPQNHWSVSVTGARHFTLDLLCGICHTTRNLLADGWVTRKY